MRHIYLSPHFDDVVLSCAGLVWEQVQAGQQVQVWTVCAGEPAPGQPLSAFARQLHARWETGTNAVAVRRAEDEAACTLLGAQTRFWDLPDCIYRRLPDETWLVNGEEDLWKAVDPGEEVVVDRLVGWLEAGLQPQDRLISPLTLGNHVDHFLVRAAAERAALESGCELWYYPDYPYVARPDVDWSGKLEMEWQKVCRPVSKTALAAWQAAVACYRSQSSTFWQSRGEMYAAIENYWQAGGGACLWYQPARGGSPRGGSPRGGSPRGGSPRGGSPRIGSAEL